MGPALEKCGRTGGKKCLGAGILSRASVECGRGVRWSAHLLGVGVECGRGAATGGAHGRERRDPPHRTYII